MACRQLWASRAASYLRISVFHRSFSNAVSGDLSGYVATDQGFKYRSWSRLFVDIADKWQTNAADAVDGNSATVGITDHAQDHLGEVVYVELPEVGATVTQGEGFGAAESVKATSDINSPVSGKVVEVNEKLTSSPALVNTSPYKDGWIIKVEMSDSGELNNLMDSEKYSKFCEEEDSNH
ncbi:Glycine cleavage system H protein, mitochondrial [Glycine soja]|nr:Glycine cleavage system H protein, mitochondrial [Glycine soja]